MRENLRSFSLPRVILSGSGFFSSDMMARITSGEREPSWLKFFSLWAWLRKNASPNGHAADLDRRKAT